MPWKPNHLWSKILLLTYDNLWVALLSAVKFGKVVYGYSKNYCIFFIPFQYDLSASQFSPDGRVFQVEYAQKAVENSG